ncbi:MAG: TRAP transporter substrate-binding protein DctP [Gammaproteobacteria bacterium]|nr:TRAP transporter substrate-binding protein DctP [Gammaproteobacteria bacterium]
MSVKFKRGLSVLAILFCFSPISPIQAKTIKIATISPEGTFWMKQMRAGAKEIKEKTQGRVKFKFYPGGVMGNDSNVLRKIHIGQLHGGAVTVGTLYQSTPDTTIYGLPFLFSNLDDAEEIRKTTDKLLNGRIESNGFVNFGFAQGGFTYLMSKEPVNSFDDLRKQKSWVPEKNDVGLSVYRRINATPISLPLSDVLTGLQTGLINTVITSPIGALALQWHTHVNYVVDFPLTYLAAMMVIDKKVFSKLSEVDQAIVREVMTKVYKNIDDQNKIDNNAAREALINQGVKFVKLDDKEKSEWIKAGDFVINEMIEKYKYNKALYNAVMVNRPDAPKIH